MTQNGVLIAALDAAGMPMPKEATAATALKEAATRLREQVQHEISPSEEELTTPAALSLLLDKIVTWRLSHELRMTAARRLETIADQRETSAYHSALLSSEGGFRRAFDQAAGKFTAALDALGGRVDPHMASMQDQSVSYRAAMDAVQTLTLLAKVREQQADGGQYVANVSDRSYEQWSRICTLPSREHSLNIIRMRVGNAAMYSPDWWRELAQTPGVEIKWHDTAEQLAVLDHLPSKAKRERGVVVG